MVSGGRVHTLGAMGNLACLDAAIAVAKQHRPRPEDIERVEAVIPPHAVAVVCDAV